MEDCTPTTQQRFEHQQVLDALSFRPVRFPDQRGRAEYGPKDVEMGRLRERQLIAEAERFAESRRK